MEQNGAWGKKYDKSEYPVREKMPLHLFDIKSFVEAKSKEKFDSMFGGMPGGIMPGNNPGMIPSGLPPMFGGMPGLFDKKDSSIPSGGMNIDDLVKRIDAKIAELEEEEKEKQKLKSNLRRVKILLIGF